MSMTNKEVLNAWELAIKEDIDEALVVVPDSLIMSEYIARANKERLESLIKIQQLKRMEEVEK